jgi:hypothetical protein
VKADDILLTPAQLAKHYPVSRSSIYSACQDGLLAHYRLPAKKRRRGKYLIKESDFLAWLESNRHEAGPGAASVPVLKHLKI